MFLRTQIIMTSTAIFAFAVCQASLAQYGGGMGGGMTAPGSPTYTAPSGGYKANPALIGGLAGGGIAAAGGVYYMMHHRNLYRGCVGPDGTTLTRESDGKRFLLQGTRLKAGDKVLLKAKKSTTDTSGSTLDVQDIRKDFGACELQARQ